jgi:hypothetical protein
MDFGMRHSLVLPEDYNYWLMGLKSRRDKKYSSPRMKRKYGCITILASRFLNGKPGKDGD